MLKNERNYPFDSRNHIFDSKENEKLRLLFELIRNSRRSDLEIGKKLNLSQTTITKRRTFLEKEGYIKQYTVIPDFEKMGFEIIAFIFQTWSKAPTAETIENGKEWLKNQNSIIFSALGEGSASNIILSVHRNYMDFSIFLLKFREVMNPVFCDLQYFVVDIKYGINIMKSFSLQKVFEK